MPAVTPADLSVLPRLNEPDVTATERPTLRVVTGLSTFEGEGFPVRRPFPGKTHLTVTDPFLLSRPHGRRRVRAGRAQGHRVASAPRFRDRHLHHRRRLRPSGLHRWGRPDQQRRHPVDDSGKRAAPHRDSARGAGHQRRPLPRRTALGQPARLAEVDSSALPGHPWQQGRVAQLERWRRPRTRHRGQSRRPRRTRRDLDPDRPRPRRRSSRARSCRLPWRPDFNALVYALSGSGSTGPDRAPFHEGQMAILGEGDVVSIRADVEQPADAARARRTDPGRRADPRADRLLRAVRHEHPRGDRCRPWPTSPPGGSARSLSATSSRWSIRM